MVALEVAERSVVAQTLSAEEAEVQKAEECFRFAVVVVVQHCC